MIYCENTGSVILSNGAKKLFRICHVHSVLHFINFLFLCNWLLKKNLGDLFFSCLSCPISIIPYPDPLALAKPASQHSPQHNTRKTKHLTAKTRANFNLKTKNHCYFVTLLSLVAGVPPTHYVTGAVWFMIASFL